MAPLTPSLQALDGLSGIDSLCLWVRADERPMRGLADFLDWRMCGYLSRLLKASYFTGNDKEALLLSGAEGLPCRKVFIWGLGKEKTWTPEAIEKQVAETEKKLRLAGVLSLAMSTPEKVPEELWQKACERHFAWALSFVLFKPVNTAKVAEGPEDKGGKPAKAEERDIKTRAARTRVKKR